MFERHEMEMFEDEVVKVVMNVQENLSKAQYEARTVSPRGSDANQCLHATELWTLLCWLICTDCDFKWLDAATLYRLLESKAKLDPVSWASPSGGPHNSMLLQQNDYSLISRGLRAAGCNLYCLTNLYYVLCTETFDCLVAMNPQVK